MKFASFLMNDSKTKQVRHTACLIIKWIGYQLPHILNVTINDVQSFCPCFSLSSAKIYLCTVYVQSIKLRNCAH